MLDNEFVKKTREIPKNVELIIFDMDGVLVDSESFHCKVHKDIMEKHFNRELDIKEYPGIQTELCYLDSLMEMGITEDVDYLVELFTKRHVEVFASRLDEVVPLKKEGVRLAKELHAKGYKIAVASSCEKPIVIPLLKKLGLYDLCSTVKTGCDVENRKPAPDPYLLTLKENNVEAINAIAIEDSKSGIAAAQAAGIFCIGYGDVENTKSADAVALDDGALFGVIAKILD